MNYDLDAIVAPYITSYIREKTTHNNPMLLGLEEYARENKVPFAEPETARRLSVLTKLIKPKRILEVGCAIGYSSAIMSQGLAPNGDKITI